MQPVTRYAKSGDVHIAYQVFGEGPVDLVVATAFVSNIEVLWDEPDLARWMRYLSGRVRLVIFDKRGTGMSDRVGPLPGMDQRMDDVRAVMDAAGIQRAALWGMSEGGPLAALFAAGIVTLPLGRARSVGGQEFSGCCDGGPPCVHRHSPKRAVRLS